MSQIDNIIKALKELKDAGYDIQYKMYPKEYNKKWLVKGYWILGFKQPHEKIMKPIYYVAQFEQAVDLARMHNKGNQKTEEY